jgi:hypothetical protein
VFRVLSSKLTVRQINRGTKRRRSLVTGGVLVQTFDRKLLSRHFPIGMVVPMIGEARLAMRLNQSV